MATENTVEKINLQNNITLLLKDATALHAADFANIEDLPTRNTVASLTAKLQEIIDALKGKTAAVALAAFALAIGSSAFGAPEVQTARFDEIWNDEPVVTNVTGLTDLATTNRVEELARETAGVRLSSWNRPGDWTVVATPERSPKTSTIVSVVTNTAGVVISNTVDVVAYLLSAALEPVILDQTGMYPTPNPAYATEEENLSITGNVATATKGGMYSATATWNGETKNFKVPLMYRANVAVTNMYYVEDAETADGFVKRTNDEWISDASSLSSDGVVHSWSNQWWVGTYKKWTGVTIPCTAGASHRFSRHAISPHVLATCAHYGEYMYWLPVWSTFYDQNGVAKGMNTAEKGKGADCWNLAEWAVQNGWSEAEIANMGGQISDVIVYVVDGDKYDLVPDNCCPYFMSHEARMKRYGVNEGDREVPFVGGWATSQCYGRDAIPCLVMAAGHPPELSRNSFALLAYAFDSELTSGWKWELGDVDRRFYNSPNCRKDISGLFASRGTQAEYWMFPPVFVGDSGNAFYLKVDGRWVLIGQYYASAFGMAAGPDFSTALPILKKFCAQFGDAIKEIQ